MAALVFRCPTTGRHIDPGIEAAEMTQSGAHDVGFTALHVRCPHCGVHHEIKIDEAMLSDAA